MSGTRLPHKLPAPFTPARVDTPELRSVHDSVSHKEMAWRLTRSPSSTHPRAAHDEEQGDVEAPEPDGLHGLFHGESPGL